MQVQEGNVIPALTTNLQHIGHVHTAGVPGRADIDETRELYYPAIVRIRKGRLSWIYRP